MLTYPAAMTNGPFSTVIFDMDGVLVDSEPLHFESTRVLLAEFRLEFTGADNREFLGSTDRVMFSVLMARHGLAGEMERLIDRRKQIYFELLQKDGLPWREGIRELVTELAESGRQLGLASSGLRRIVEHTLEGGGIRRHFGAVVSADDIAAAKPDPAIYLEAARRLQVEPSLCVAVEDTDVGVRAAKNAGMRVIAFPTATTASMDLSPADFRADTVADIRRYLNGGGGRA